VQVIAFSDAGTQVLQLPVRPDGDAADAPSSMSGSIVVPQFGAGVSRVVVAISPLVPVTLVPVDFSLDATLR